MTKMGLAGARSYSCPRLKASFGPQDRFAKPVRGHPSCHPPDEGECIQGRAFVRTRRTIGYASATRLAIELFSRRDRLVLDDVALRADQVFVWPSAYASCPTPQRP